MNPSNLRIAWKDGLRSLIQKAIGRRVGLTAKWRVHQQASRRAEDLERLVADRTRELQQSVERFRQVAESAGEWIWEVDAEGVYRYCSSAVEAMLGYAPEELVGKKHFYDLFVPEAREELKANAMAAFTQRVSFRKMVNANLHKNGKTVIAETSGSPVLDEQGHFLGYRGTDADITERKQAEELLRETNQILDEILRTITVRVFWKDRNLTYLGCNPVFAGDAGFSDPGDIVGKDDFQMAWRDQAELYRADDRSVIASGRPRLLIEEPQTTPAGDTIWLLTNKVPLRDSTGEIRGVLGTYMDVTEQKRAQAEREEMEKQLQAKLKLASVGTLARGMAHEINNPIMGIANYAQLIKDNVEGNVTLAGYAYEIIAEVQRVAKMTHSLLRFTEQQADEPFASAMPIDMVASVLSTAEQVARERGIVLSCEVPANLPPVFCCKSRIGYALTALFTNAVEAFEEGTTVAGEARTIRLSAQRIEKKGQTWLRLTLRNNGPIIPKVICSRLFDPFYTTKDRTQHSGLGLWISQSIVQVNNGEISFESEAGLGTLFHVDLPVSCQT